MSEEPEPRTEPMAPMAPEAAASELTPEALAALEELTREPSESPTAREMPDARISAPASAPAIALEAPPLESLSLDHLRLLGQNIQLLMSRNDQQGQLLQDSADRLHETRQELTDSLSLFQSILADMDEKIERMGMASAALIRLHQEQTRK